MERTGLTMTETSRHERRDSPKTHRCKQTHAHTHKSTLLPSVLSVLTQYLLMFAH